MSVAFLLQFEKHEVIIIMMIRRRTEIIMTAYNDTAILPRVSRSSQGQMIDLFLHSRYRNHGDQRVEDQKTT